MWWYARRPFRGCEAWSIVSSGCWQAASSSTGARVGVAPIRTLAGGLARGESWSGCSRACVHSGVVGCAVRLPGEKEENSGGQLGSRARARVRAIRK